MSQAGTLKCCDLAAGQQQRMQLPGTTPSREKATLENPQIFQSCKFKNFISAAIARAKRRQFQIVHPTNERSLTYLESTTP